MTNEALKRSFEKVFLNLIKVCAPLTAAAVIAWAADLIQLNPSQNKIWISQTTQEVAPCRDLLEFFSQVMYMPTETAQARGLEVTQLKADTWAARNLAIQIGDIITAINGQTLKGSLKEIDMLTSAICGLGKGRALAVDLVRGNQQLRIRNQSAKETL